ncbi:MAG: FtsW/RodA/SpoVE family cell cycle protein, partial [Kiritimatiellae bacterium]|nr:FtsW/RodA/SpoVE family cell cycle protein [Kiritimatiellia bacterium]
GARTAARARGAFASCTAAGLVACLGFQTLLNLAGVTKALPLTGIPLPLVSHGGSSLVATLVMVGLLMAVSDEAPEPRP